MYRAHWRHTPVAVKCMLTSNMTKDSRNLFFQEIKIMAQLRHPNIVQFIGVVGESTKGFAIVMEYMSEGTLSTLLKNRDIEINWERGCRLSLGIAHALAFLHYTTLHRDVKSPFPDVQNFNALLQKHEVLSKGDDIPQETPETYKNLILLCWNKVLEERPKAKNIVLKLEKFETELKEQKETSKIIRFPND